MDSLVQGNLTQTPHLHGISSPFLFTHLPLCMTRHTCFSMPSVTASVTEPIPNYKLQDPQRRPKRPPPVPDRQYIRTRSATSLARQQRRLPDNRSFSLPSSIPSPNCPTMVPALRQTQLRSNKHSNIKNLLRCRRTMGHEATVGY